MRHKSFVDRNKFGMTESVAFHVTLKFTLSSLATPSLRDYWIDANDMNTEGEWRWTDGTDIEYVNWRPGKPINRCEMIKPSEAKPHLQITKTFCQIILFVRAPKDGKSFVDD